MLLHGPGSSAESWRYQLETLEGYRRIAWDAPGSGDATAALREFIDSLLLKDVVLVARSEAGLAATEYARLVPERVRSMILIAPPSAARENARHFRKKLLVLSGDEEPAQLNAAIAAFVR